MTRCGRGPGSMSAVDLATVEEFREFLRAVSRVDADASLDDAGKAEAKRRLCEAYNERATAHDRAVAPHACPPDGRYPCSTCGRHAHEVYAEIQADLDEFNRA